MPKTILGIDPGKEGGFAVLDGDSVIVEPMPLTDDGDLDVPELHRLIAYYAPSVSRCYLEMASMRPNQSGQFLIGRNFGKLEAVLVLAGVKFELVQPQTWSAHYPHGVTETDRAKRYKAIKAARRRIVAGLYPGIDLKKTARSTTDHEGMVDALLIADYGFRINHSSREEPK